MCTCTWSAKTLTPRVWKTKNTGTRSQQIISSSLEVRVLGCRGLQEFHCMALLSVSCRCVSTNRPLALFSDVIQMLEADGKVAIKDGSIELLKLPLRCHVCSKELPTIPALKEHIKSHFPSWDCVSRMKGEFSGVCIELRIGLFFVSSFETKPDRCSFCHLCWLGFTCFGYFCLFVCLFVPTVKIEPCLMFVISCFHFIVKQKNITVLHFSRTDVTLQ